MSLELQLPPGKTAPIQLLVRVVGTDVPGASVGSSIAGVPDGTNPTIYRYSLGSYVTGDYWAQLSGVSNPNGLPFPLRNGVAYPGIPWSIVDATVFIPPVIAPPSVANVCRVQLLARRGAIAIAARLVITCGTSGRLAESAFTNVAFDGQIDDFGLLLVDLPWSSVPGEGVYKKYHGKTRTQSQAISKHRHLRLSNLERSQERQGRNADDREGRGGRHHTWQRWLASPYWNSQVSLDRIPNGLGHGRR